MVRETLQGTVGRSGRHSLDKLTKATHNTFLFGEKKQKKKEFLKLYISVYLCANHPPTKTKFKVEREGTHFLHYLEKNVTYTVARITKSQPLML